MLRSGIETDDPPIVRKRTHFVQNARHQEIVARPHLPIEEDFLSAGEDGRLGEQFRVQRLHASLPGQFLFP